MANPESRKLAICALEKYNPSTARNIFDEIPEVCRSCPLTLYLVYRLALLAGDASLCKTYFTSIYIIGFNQKPRHYIH